MPRRCVGGQLRRADVHAAVELHRVGVDDLGRAAASRELLGEVERELGLAGARRADEGDEHRSARRGEVGRPMLTARGAAGATAARRVRGTAQDSASRAIPGVARAGATDRERRRRRESAMRKYGVAWVTTTLTTSPGRGIVPPAGTSKCTRRLSSARPERRWFRSSFGPRRWRRAPRPCGRRAPGSPPRRCAPAARRGARSAPARPPSAPARASSPPGCRDGSSTGR